MKFRLEQFVSGKWLLAITFAAASQELGARDTNNVPPPPAPPVVQNRHEGSPIDYFRKLLAMSPGEREQALAKEPEERRKILASKIVEYEAMSKEERELRLRMTQLRWYLVPLMKSSPDKRNQMLEQIPEEDRALIIRRLKLWDEIPVQVQKEFLENELHLGYLLKRGITEEQRSEMLKAFPPDRRQKLEQELAKWNALPEKQRDEITARFNQFFELNDREKDRILDNLSKADRQKMEQTLKSLENLPPGERKQYIEAFDQFARMSPEERRKFLRNAERWQAMTPAEKEAWRAVVQRSLPTPPLPPIPSANHKQPPLPPPLATNNAAAPQLPK